MPHLNSARFVFSAVIVLVTSSAVLIASDLQTAGIAAVGMVVLLLVASGAGDPQESGVTAASDGDRIDIAEAIDGIFEPVLLVIDNHVTAANRAAQALLGAHILDEDVRVAIRHPAAAERLLEPHDDSDGTAIHLVGLGSRDQHWEMRVHRLRGGQRIVHLSDHTGSRAADRIRVDFVANASHELRTPLASILGFIETLEDATDDPETSARFLKVMDTEARRMQRLIDDLMSLSRIEAEKFRAPDDSVDLGTLAQEVRAELAALAPERAADVSIEIEDNVPVRGDRVQLSQLLHNIIGNAMKYGRGGTPVRVVLNRPGEAMICLSVSDESEGIPPEHLPRLTERFYRVDSSRSRAAGGTGLGLAIVKHIVERHRGRLDITSTVGTGTTLTVLLPVACAQEPLS